MHMSDALVAPAVATGMYAASAVVASISVKKLCQDEYPPKLPAMAVSAALVFAGQMVNYTIPGTGSSGHLCGGMMLSALLGPHAGFLSMTIILAIQCLFFADGGLLALGANIWNMAFYGCFVGYFLIWKPIMHSGLFMGKNAKAASRAKIMLASVLGCIVTIQLASFSVVLETTVSGITELPFAVFLSVMQPIHLIIGLVEGLITSSVLLFVYHARPELLTELTQDTLAQGKFSLETTLILLSLIVVVTGGGLSLSASSNPDGLEWAIFGNTDAGYGENMGLDENSFGSSCSAANVTASIQEKTAFLPDYNFADKENAAGTTLSGLLGSAIVAGIAAFVCMAGSFFRKRRFKHQAL